MLLTRTEFVVVTLACQVCVCLSHALVLSHACLRASCSCAMLQLRRRTCSTPTVRVLESFCSASYRIDVLPAATLYLSAMAAPLPICFVAVWRPHFSLNPHVLVDSRDAPFLLGSTNASLPSLQATVVEAEVLFASAGCCLMPFDFSASLLVFGHIRLRQFAARQLISLPCPGLKR
jgi:hypothetical protein